MTIYDARARSDAAILYNDEPSCAKQDFRDSVNVNNILRKYAKNGNNPFVVTSDAKYGDFTNVPSYQEALDLVISADEHFMQLSADVRARFLNDPGKLLEFLADPSNLDEARSLGLVNPKVLDPEISLSKASLEALSDMVKPKA